MTAKEMWAAFAERFPEAAQQPYDAWCYGDAPDELAELTRKGIKTATASAYALYGLEGEPLPKAGEFSIILWSDQSAACIIRTENVYVVPFRDVSENQAYREGEGDRTLACWRTVHERFFRKELEETGLVFTEEMDVVCEEFEVVFPL